MTKAGVVASSKTHRKIVNTIANRYSMPARHSSVPSADVDTMLDAVDEQTRKRLIAIYRKGLRRGLDLGTTMLLNGEFKHANGEITWPKDGVTVAVRLKFKGTPWERTEFKFAPKELGFN